MSVFGAKKSEEQKYPVAHEHTSGQPSSLIGKTLHVKGEVVSDDDVMIDGHVDGKITVKKRLTIGRNAVIKSEIDAFAVIIQGRVEGNVKCKNLLEIVPGGSLIGNIFSAKVVIADGAFFEGNVDMRGRGPDDKNSSPLHATEKSNGIPPSIHSEKETPTSRNQKK